MHAGLHVKYPLFLLDFNESSTVSIDSRKILLHKHCATSRKVSGSIPSGVAGDFF